MRKFFAARWRGDVPLQRLLWRDMLLVGTSINLATTLVALFAWALGGLTAVGFAIHFAPLPYNAFLLCAVWRSAERAAEPGASAARIGAVLWMVAASVF